MSTFANKSIAQLEEEIRQLEGRASKQQSSALSYEQALRQSQTRLAEVERNRVLQQDHLRQLQSDIKLKHDSARDAREAAASRMREVERRKEDGHEQNPRHKEKRRAPLQLEDFEIRILAKKMQRDDAARAAFRALNSGCWSTEEFQLCQAMIWEAVSGTYSKQTIDIAANVVAALEDDDVVVISVNSIPDQIMQRLPKVEKGGLSQSPPTLPGPPAMTPTKSESSSKDKRRSHSINSVHRRAVGSPYSSPPRSPAMQGQQSTRSPKSQPAETSIRPQTGSSQWDVHPPSTSKGLRISNGADFFNIAPGEHDARWE